MQRSTRPFLAILLLAAPLLGGCPGEIEDPVEFRIARANRCPSDFDVEQDLFVRTCGALGCHTGGAGLAAAGLDLTTDGVGDRLLAHTSSDCDGRPMIDEADLASSYFLEKLGPSPACGDPMPAGLPALNPLERQCLEEYLAELAGVDPPMVDAGTPRDAGPATDAGPAADAGEPTPVTIEAEDMTLAGYVVDSADMTLIRLPDMTASGTATATFMGAPGSYQMSVFVVEEPDGAPSLTIRVAGGDVATEQYAMTAMNNEPRTLGPYPVTLATGDEIQLEGTSDAGAWARVDRVELVP